MTDMDMVSKAEVLDIYAELYDEFDDAPGVINELHKVCDKLKRLQPQDIVRCKDCKHGAYVVQTGMLPFITCGGVDHDLDWFCADGERW